MNDKFYNTVGLCRRAGKLCMGHDEVKNSVKNGRAKLVLLTADSSQRLFEEMGNLTDRIPVIRIDATMEEMQIHIGKHAGVYSVTDGGLKDLVLSTLKEDSIHGTD